MESMKSCASKVASVPLNRRSFLKALGAATVAAAIPSSYADGGVVENLSPISITYPEGKEWGVIVDAGGHTLIDVFEFIQSIFKSDSFREKLRV